MTYNYSMKEAGEDTARAAVRDVGISLKKTEEIFDRIRYKTTSFSQRLLNDVIEKKRPVPFRKYLEDAAHKRGTGPGKYPVNAAKEVLNLIKMVEANARQKGLGEELKIVHISVKKAARPMRSGRHRGKMKRVHAEIIVKELSKPKGQEAKKTPQKKSPEPENKNNTEGKN